jgi:hypothetical protein
LQGLRFGLLAGMSLSRYVDAQKPKKGCDGLPQRPHDAGPDHARFFVMYAATALTPKTAQPMISALYGAKG